ncbi:hypothetical protein DOS77_11400 [Staphylococcus felis]|nr:hypothetical protein DOS69_10970 [Staphylococcus felis]REI19722.1 hypothetical protein DOS77_11400 [Staphylococcus felis]
MIIKMNVILIYININDDINRLEHNAQNKSVETIESPLHFYFINHSYCLAHRWVEPTILRYIHVINYGLHKNKVLPYYLINYLGHVS